MSHSANSAATTAERGARLPWADDATAQIRAAKTNATPAPAQPISPSTRPAPTKSSAHFYLTDDEKPKRSTFENLADFLMLASGLLVGGALIYFVWFRATGGMVGKGLTFLPIGLIARFIINKLFDD